MPLYTTRSLKGNVMRGTDASPAMTRYSASRDLLYSTPPADGEADESTAGSATDAEATPADD